MQFTPGTKRFNLAQHFANNVTREHAFSICAPLVREQRRPWIFSRNVDGSRIPKPIDEQLVELKNEIGRVWGLLEREGVPDSVRNRPIPDAAQPVKPAETEAKPKAAGKLKKDEEKRFFQSEWRRIRKWISDRQQQTQAKPIDSLDSMRPVREARRAIEQGIPARAMLFSMTMHWPEDARREAGIEDFDFYSFAPDMGKGFHRLVGYIVMLAKARIPVMLVGPAGTGKSHICNQVSEILEMDYAEAAMTAGATRGDFLGRMTANPDVPFVESQLLPIYQNGGVFNFEEMDAAEANMLIVMNNALASNKLFNSANGQEYEKSDNFVPMSTANTFGLGGNADYTGREKLDFATIDRWRMGRVLVKLDEDLADYMMFG
jgi:hypothetical protein